MLGEVRQGLALEQKELPPKYFYDHRGSLLFDEITRLPEYYLTRAERALLAANMSALIAALGSATLVELGAGSADKTRAILDPMVRTGSGRRYVPVDVSAEFLDETAARLRSAYPALEITPLVADLGDPLPVAGDLPPPVLFAFLGSTIGNFDRASAVRLLSRLRPLMRADDRLLLGADLRKDARIVEAAYNDSRGVTAEFNRNMLHVLNHELGADFDPDAFAHRAFYDRRSHRIEMHLVAGRPMVVEIPGMPRVSIARGESIRTEISCKYNRASLRDMLSEAGLRLMRWMTDADETYALLIAAPRVALA
jgi:L-histidine N-alpha-methyltransferase